MEKVKLPREVAEALEDIKVHFERFEYHVMLSIFHQGMIARESADVLRNFAKFHNNIELIIRALANGWEFEQTPEDKVREWFQLHIFNKEHAVTYEAKSNYDIMMTAGIQILDMLNIKIDGVNK